MQLLKPVSPWRITQDFGANPAYYAQFGQIGHSGIDIGVPIGTPVYAAADGTIEYEGDGKNLSYMGAIAGICCVINHGTIMTGYAHLSNTVVNKGQKVKQGQLIGHSGNTGTSTGAHMHFEVIALPMNTNNGYYGRVDPNPYLTGGSMDKITKEQEKTLSLMQTGSYPGKNYDYRFTGKDLTQANLDSMLQFWSKQPRPSTEYIKITDLYIKK